MSQYLFQLGHCPDLSYAEIVAVHDRFSSRFTALQHIEQIAIAESSSSDAIQPFCDELGGTIRAAEILYTEPFQKDLSIVAITADRLLEFFLSAHVDSLLTERSKRPVFGISLIGVPEGKFNERKIHSLLHETAGLLKEVLREREISCRFLLPDPKENSFCLSGAQVDKNQLLEEGMEIVLHIHPRCGLQIARTVWLQHYEEYSKRDYGRPGRDARSGMLPPKLARILINLARTQNTQSLLDPFCGSGGIVTEAAMMGLQATGIDNSSKAIADTVENWNWLKSHTPISSGSVRALAGDARQLHAQCEPLFFDACVSEPYLGPPQTRPLDPGRFDSMTKELVALYLRALGEIRIVVKPGSRVVFVAPRFRLNGEKPFGSMPFLSEIKLQGYTLLNPLENFQPSRGRQTLIYSRPKQVVQREIFVLQA